MFLQLSAALGPALLGPNLLRPALAIASTLPLPFAHRRVPDVEAWLLNEPARGKRRLDSLDLLLVPAYAAAELIRREWLYRVAGPSGRPHDPDGAFTVPYALHVGAILFRGAPPKSLDALWRADTIWPDSARLVLGAALLRRGYPLNDAHPGHLAQIEQDLLDLRPRIAGGDPVAGLRSGQAAVLALMPAHAAVAGPSVFLPPEGVALVEYDWVIPAEARHPGAAQDFIADMTCSPLSSHAVASRLIPFTPLPASARVQRDRIWARLKARAA
jgi:hypothetical protein